MNCPKRNDNIDNSAMKKLLLFICGAVWGRAMVAWVVEGALRRESGRSVCRKAVVLFSTQAS